MQWRMGIKEYPYFDAGILFRMWLYSDLISTLRDHGCRSYHSYKKTPSIEPFVNCQELTE
jgi:hypothetical protein